jgi:hypothetical protein
MPTVKARSAKLRALGEVAGGVDGFVGVWCEAVVGVPDAAVLPYPRTDTHRRRRGAVPEMTRPNGQ